MRLAVAGTLGLAGLLFATTAGSARGTDLRPGDRGNLVDLVRSAQDRLTAQSRHVEELRREIDTATLARAAGTGPTDGDAGAQRERLLELARTAATEPVRGPAITVVLDDAPRSRREAAPADSGPDDFVVHQQDVQAVVNALWAGGAEAMQLMDQRVISTSAVRCVGNTLLLQGRVYSPPYRITAIGPVPALRRSLDESGDVLVYRDYAERLGLRYAVRTMSSVDIPGYSGSLDLLHAKALAETSRDMSPGTSPSPPPTRAPDERPMSTR